ncbi:hypothetical protein [Paragemmobacter straminiformis]|uniref:Uncharacterized protein n=1 Tax=Paragemmobacter straminiformis TaxID=2045119 RepID=A0A842IB46_9RHOB|nr:hypothetical protein [Gemmobacter straminiformis]MBC2836895.1 hypothetical protein [Gemmobacter straminiformis]
MERVGQGLVLSLLIVLAVLGGGGLAVAAAVAWLQPVAGLGGALALTAGGLFAVALVLALVLRSVLRKARRRRNALAPMIGMVEVILAVMPRRRVMQLEATLAAGMAIGTVLLHLLKAEEKT